MGLKTSGLTPNKNENFVPDILDNRTQEKPAWLEIEPMNTLEWEEFQSRKVSEATQIEQGIGESIRLVNVEGVEPLKYAAIRAKVKSVHEWEHRNDAPVELMFGTRIIQPGETFWIENGAELADALKRGSDPKYGVWASHIQNAIVSKSVREEGQLKNSG